MHSIFVLISIVVTVFSWWQLSSNYYSPFAPSTCTWIFVRFFGGPYLEFWCSICLYSHAFFKYNDSWRLTLSCLLVYSIQFLKLDSVASFVAQRRLFQAKQLSSVWRHHFTSTSWWHRTNVGGQLELKFAKSWVFVYTDSTRQAQRSSSTHRAKQRTAIYCHLCLIGSGSCTTETLPTMLRYYTGKLLQNAVCKHVLCGQQHHVQWCHLHSIETSGSKSVHQIPFQFFRRRDWPARLTLYCMIYLHT